MRLPVVRFLALAAIVVACTTAGAGPTGSAAPGSAGATGASGLDGRAFLSTAVTEHGAARPLVAGTRVRVAFTGGRVSAQAGCNTMGAPYTLTGSTLKIDELAMTAMGCGADRNDQDTWLAGFLGGDPSVAVSPTGLTLQTATTTIAFVDEQIAVPDLPLVGTAWTVESLFQGDTVSSTAGVTAGLRFDADGRVAVNTGCNTGSATYTVDAAALTITFGPVALTKKACADPAGEVETVMVTVLGTGVVGSRLDGAVLELRTNEFGISFRGAPAS